MDSCARSKSRSQRGGANDTVVIVVHGTVVAGPVTASSLPVAKAFACSRARIVLQDPEEPRALSRLCDCAGRREGGTGVSGGSEGMAAMEVDGQANAEEAMDMDGAEEAMDVD